jgi:hypothetical protein
LSSEFRRRPGENHRAASIFTDLTRLQAIPYNGQTTVILNSNGLKRQWRPAPVWRSPLTKGAKPMMTPAEKEFFLEHGYLHVPGVLTGDHLTLIQDEFDRVWELEKPKVNLR